ncbi:PREDICTED: probable cytochrome P450 305a1 [Vollenhovia emeryi]|uniref:probable cytochrome P450 305a1 n=1 Tax=Vollenhovia emeryi TaxID=411798 RepID=UPI0005F49310|nr:PREDICTED: probable cytochrome P450 305a1 [Vollenhovia emeryi]XP_011861105.1 PREDICTED: probable cytochrome P450 305a1 [Vollenhovia emeryi]
MSVAIILAVLTILLITVYLRQTPKRPPGPFPWPFIGSRYYLQKLTRQLGGQHIAFLELSKIYNSGIISLRLGSNSMLIVSDSKLIHDICLNEKYDGRPWNEFTKLRNMGLRKGITLNDGAEWKELRGWTVRTLRSVGFAKRAMMDLLVDEMTLILQRLADGGVRQIRPVIAPAVINVLWMLVTGRKPSENLPRLQKFIDLLDRRAQQFDMTGGILSTFPWIRYIAPEMSGYNILVTLNNELKSFLMDTINEHKERYVKGNETDFIDMFLYEMYNSEAQRDKVSAVFSDDNLLVTLIDFFIAGTSNTTSTLDILFLQMANHQEVQRKLQEEIDDVIGLQRFPNLEDRVKMPFTEAILTECQRMWVVTPMIGPRRVLGNTTLNGYKIPENTIVLMNIYANNMDPKNFPDPTSFKPERYINKAGTYELQENIILFGKGKRRCPGEALAKSAIFLLFVSVMQKYRLLPVPGEKYIRMDLKTGLTISPKPYEMLIVPR